jgi:hypothetical protein
MMKNWISASGFLHAVGVNAHQDMLMLILSFSANNESLAADGRLAKRQHFNGSCPRTVGGRERAEPHRVAYSSGS